MASSHDGKLSVKEKGLRYKLLIIEALIFVLPFLILSYIFYRNKFFLELYQIVIFALTLALILAGLITLRQVFDRFSMLATSIKKAKAGDSSLMDIQEDTAELHEITVSFNNLMKEFKDTTDELQRRVFELFAIKELTEVASKSLDIDYLLNVLLEKAMAVSRAQIGSVLMVESEKDRFRVIASRGPEPGAKKDSYININESLTRHVVSDKKPLIVQDIETDPRTLKPNEPKYGPPSFLSMPIFVREDLISVLNLSHKETKQVFDSNDEQILSIMIGEIGFALENARLYLRAEEHLKNLQEHAVKLSNANDQLQKEIIERNQAGEDLRNTLQELQETKDMLVQSEKLAAIGRLTTGITHEILNPVNIISMRMQLVNKTEDLSDRTREALSICKSQLNRIAEITKELGQFARIPKKDIIMSDLNKVIGHILTLYEPQFKVDDINTDIQFHPDLPLIPLDKDRIEQVIFNIISNANASMAGQKNKMLRIITKPTASKDYVQAIISDTGTGIDSSDMNKIFEPFFTTKDQPQGTGLGLFISYNIIQDHGGRIWAENNEWGGASFFIELPVVRDMNS